MLWMGRVKEAQLSHGSLFEKSTAAAVHGELLLASSIKG